MEIRVAVYNVEWMRDLFHDDGTPKSVSDTNPDHAKQGVRSATLASIVDAMDADVIGIVEGPNTLVNGSKTASAQLESWVHFHGLNNAYKAVHGYPSGGQQELCALYRSDKLHIEFSPEARLSKHPFNKPFLVDTTDSLIKEQYKHYRPPLELCVNDAQGSGNEFFRIIVAHSKSKGIFDSVDFARFEQLSERNRRKLYAECFSIRERCNQWMDEAQIPNIIVMGDINDGFGLDHYEQRFCRSAVELLLGDPWEPRKILKHVLPRPKLRKFGWEPSSSRFTDRITGDRFNVLIDHILMSRGLKVSNADVWNPHMKDAPAHIKSLKKQLVSASDHYPVVCDLEIAAVPQWSPPEF